MQCEGCTLFTARDSQLYTQLYRQGRSEISDNCLNSRVAWNAGFYYQKALIADCLSLVSDGGIFTSPHVTWPAGQIDRERLLTIIDTLWPVFQNRGWPFRLMYIDEASLPLLHDLPGYKVRLAFDADYSDYLYAADDLRELSGKDLHGKRNHFNRFCRAHPDFAYHQAGFSDRDEALALVKNWCDERKLDCLNLCLSDYRAIRQLFDDFDLLDIRGGVIRISGRIAAFALGSLLNDDTAVIHFEKADAAYPGIYSAINKLVLDHAFPEAKYVNREEDMGISGLRKAKQSYGPIRLIKKYEAIIRKA